MNRRDVLTAGLIIICVVAWLQPLISIGVDPHHDGALIKPAVDVRSGQFLFRDTFTQYGALTCYLHALSLVFDNTLWGMRCATLGIYALTLWCLYASWRMLLPRSLTVMACALFVLFNPAYETDPWNHDYWLLVPWSSAYAMMFQAIGLYALFRVIRGEQPERWGLVLGLATAAVFWCRQPVGIMMAGALFAIWLALHWTGWQPAQSSKRAILGRILAGLLGLHALFFGGFALSGALPAWWAQNIAWPARWSHAMKWGDTLPVFAHPAEAAGLVALLLALALPGVVRRLRPGQSVAPWPAYYAGLAVLLLWQHEWLLRVISVRDGGWSIVIPVVVAALAVVSIVVAVRRRGAPQPVEYYQAAAWAALGLASLVQYYPIADVWHFFYSQAPIYGLVLFAAWRWSGRSAAVVVALFAVLLLPSAVAKVRIAVIALNRPLVTLTKPAILRGMRVPPEQARDLGQIADTLALAELHRPGVPTVLIGNDALYLTFVANHTNPTAYYVTWQGLASQADNLQRWAYIHRERPVMILQKARWEAVDEFYARARYVPVLYVQAEFLEIAVPQELADAMGVKIYSLFGLGRPRPRH